jgi:hypothetical protein
MPKNKTVIERHGCIVCGSIYNVVAIYTPDGRLVDCTVTSSGGHCMPDERQPMVVYDFHNVGEIETAYNRWIARKVEEEDKEQEDE